VRHRDSERVGRYHGEEKTNSGRGELIDMREEQLSIYIRKRRRRRQLCRDANDCC
jgi:hypothetical protein